MSGSGTADNTKWRVLGLLALLLVIGYVTGFLVAYNSDSSRFLGPLDELPPELTIGLALAPLLILALAARDRSFKSPSLKVLWSFLAAFGLTMLLFLALGSFDSLVKGWRSLGSIALEAGYGFWRTFFTLAWLATLSWLHPPSRDEQLSLSIVPLFVWGLESTSNHWLSFHGHIRSELTWYLALASGLALIVLLSAIAAWRWLTRAAPPRRGLQAAVLLTILTVLFDWGYTLYATSILQTRDVEARAKELAEREFKPADSCEPTALALPTQEVQANELRTLFRPVLVGCDETIRCLSSDQKAAIAARLAEVVAEDVRAEFERRHAADRWKELAALVEEHLGCAVAEEIILTDFAVEESSEEPAGAAVSEPMRVGGDVLAPRRISSDSSALEPLFSEFAQTVCIVETVVTKEGRLEQIELLVPKDCMPEPQQTILRMFESWRYEPATLYGKPVAVRYHLTIHHCPCVSRVEATSGLQPAAEPPGELG